MHPWQTLKYGKVPVGFAYIQPILEALENEAREKVNESHEGKRKFESITPVIQIAWQKSRYVYDLFYTFKRIGRDVYDYCVRAKVVDAALIAKWKKPGYEFLCSTYVITPSNYKFGGTSICRVPNRDRAGDNEEVCDAYSGCLGCASGSTKGGNIFGNKYGQRLAGLQIGRERREERRRVASFQASSVSQGTKEGATSPSGSSKDVGKKDEDAGSEEEGTGPGPAATQGGGDSDTDDSSDDEGPQVANIWGSKEEVEKAEKEEEEEEETKEEECGKPTKKKQKR